MLRFSKSEFWTLTRLRCTSDYDNPSIIDISKSNFLVEKYFSKNCSIHHLDAIVSMVNNHFSEFPNAKSSKCIVLILMSWEMVRIMLKNWNELMIDKYGKDDEENSEKHKKNK